MRKRDLSASLFKLAKTVSATVTACVVILLILQPWRGGTSRDDETAAIAQGDAAGGKMSSEKPVLLAVTDIAEAEPGEAGEIEETATGGEIRLASRQGRGRNRNRSVPLPEKNEPVPLPARNEERPDPALTRVAVAADEPEIILATQEIDNPAPAQPAVPSPPVLAAMPSPALVPNPPSPPAAAPPVEAPLVEAPAVVAAMPAPSGQLPKADGDAALAPLIDYKFGDTEIANVKEFVEDVRQGEYSDARELMQKMRDPVAVKFAIWFYYRSKAPDTTAREINDFLAENPRWPGRAALEEGAEDALFWREEDAGQVLAYYKDRQPVSGSGKAALGAAHLAQGRTDEGTRLIVEAWRGYPLTEAIEKRLRKLKVLHTDDHRARADYLLIQDNKNYLKAVRRLITLIDGKWHDSLKARMATVQRAKNAGTLLSRLDKAIKREPGVMFARIQYLRRADEDARVWSLLRSAPQTAAGMIDPPEWWQQRESQVRLALNEGKPKTAYAIASEHGAGLDHASLSEAEFLAGWLALRFLEKPEAAREHFVASAAAGGLPKRRARAAYWLGRTELVLGNKTEAVARFAEAAQHNHTFYGQLAYQMISETDVKVAFRTFVRPTKAEIDDFVSQDVMKAIVLIKRADLESLLPLFLFDLARQIESAPDMILLCELAIRVAPPHHAVRMAKLAMNRDFAVEYYAYPNALPDFKSLGSGDIENALVHALTRQESEFNPGTVSSAGAIGLMQLLPSTAKLVAKQFDVKFSKKKLTDDPSYNVSLGSAFLSSLIRSYDGSYIMALAGYNAGPGRVRDWVKLFGDPRKTEVDPIDWIERIPFLETREYVHKILESAQIYRSRLGADRAMLRLAEDLHRGRKDKPNLLSGMIGN
jgi:soluble lytic murein transglycosylase